MVFIQFSESASSCLWLCKPEDWAKEQKEHNSQTEKILKTCANEEIALNNHKAISKSRAEEGEKRQKKKRRHMWIAKQKLTSNSTPFA